METYVQRLQKLEKRNQAIKRLAAKGVKQAEIARRFDVTRQRIAAILAK